MERKIIDMLCGRFPQLCVADVRVDGDSVYMTVDGGVEGWRVAAAVFGEFPPVRYVYLCRPECFDTWVYTRRTLAALLNDNELYV